MPKTDNMGLIQISMGPVSRDDYPNSDDSFNDNMIRWYRAGDYGEILKYSETEIANFVDRLSGSGDCISSRIVVDLFFVSQVYKAQRESDKYAACLKLLYSAQPVRNSLRPIYREYIDIGTEEYLALAQKVGPDHLNGLELTRLFKKKSGCFIATACYDSYDAPEVHLLRQFRDNVLLRYAAGRLFVGLYYTVSPPAARLIARSNAQKTWVRFLFIAPIVGCIRRFYGDSR